VIDIVLVDDAIGAWGLLDVAVGFGLLFGERRDLGLIGFHEYNIGYLIGYFKFK
jgi:hypothetical protein